MAGRSTPFGISTKRCSEIRSSAEYSSISNGARTVAIDARGAVFVSKNGGKHWDAVSTAWAGRPVQVSLAGAADEGRMYSLRATTTAAGRADLSGSVKDPAGASIPGATVRLEELSGKEVQTSRSDQLGAFTLVKLAPGAYRLDVSAPGFESSMRQVELHADERMSVDTVLQVGSVSQTVEVSSDATVSENKKKPAAKPVAFQLTTDSGTVWISSDGKSWKRK